jgi:Chaperone of endosialidase
MALPITVPFTFGNATTTQNLSSLDTDFSTVYNAVNGIGNGTVSLANVSITNGKATFSTANVSSGNWLPYPHDDTGFATFYSITNPNSAANSQNVPQIGVLGATESTSVTPQYATPRALEGLAFNRSLNGCTTWSLYLEAHRGLTTENVGSANLGTVYGIELDVLNFGNEVTGWNPYYTPNGNGTIGMSIEVGAGQSPTNQSSATCAMYFASNPTPASASLSFGAGLIIFDGAIGPYGSGGTKPAILMPYDNQIQWYTSGSNGTLAASLVSDASGNFFVSSNTAGVIFKSTNTEAGRFNPSGAFLLGTTGTIGGNGKFCISASSGWAQAIQVGNTSTSGILTTNTSGTGNYTAMAFYNNGTTFSSCGAISVSGSATSYATTSDYRLKDNFTPLTNALQTIKTLNAVNFNWKSDGTHGEGFIAHELQEVIPYAVVGEKDALDENGNIKPQGVDYSKVVVHLVAAIQELEARLAALESK